MIPFGFGLHRFDVGKACITKSNVNSMSEKIGLLKTDINLLSGKFTLPDFDVN